MSEKDFNDVGFDRALAELKKYVPVLEEEVIAHPDDFATPHKSNLTSKLPVTLEIHNSIATPPTQVVEPFALDVLMGRGFEGYEAHRGL